MMKKIVVYLCCLTSLLFASNTEVRDAAVKHGSDRNDFSMHVPDFAVDANVKEAEESSIDKVRAALKYGIESEIIEILEKVDKYDFAVLINDFVQLAADTKMPAVQAGILKLFTRYKNVAAIPFAEQILAKYRDQQRTVVKDALAYIGGIKSEITVSSDMAKKLTPLLHTMISTDTEKYGVESLTALGHWGGASDADFLIAFFEKYSDPDEKQELIIRQYIVAALEQIHTENCWDFFIAQAENKEENAYIRSYAATGLAAIGRPDAFQILAAFFEEEEPLLRTAAIKGLASFDTPDARRLLLQGLKDSYYKVRHEALTAIQKTKDPNAASFVLYRAKHDPQESIRFAAVKTLAMLNNTAGNKWLSDTFADKKKPLRLRVAVLKETLQHNEALILPLLNGVIIPLVSDDKVKKLRYEMGKAVAAAENKNTAAICTAYLDSADVLTKSIGLDMFKTNRYPSARSIVESISAEKKSSALQRRAKDLLIVPTAVP